MFQSGETVRYGQAGLCRIEEVRTMKIGEEAREYYVLSPLSKVGALLYVPVENQELVGKMLPPLTEKEWEIAFLQVREMAPEWLRDFRRRSELSKKALNSGDRREALYLIKNIYAHKEQLLEEGKRIHTTDDYFLRDAENLIYFEYAHLLNLSFARAAELIREAIGIEK